jgi:rhamnosyltransferase
LKYKKIAGVLVCYNPNIEELSECVLSIIPQIDKLYIVDNTDKQSFLINTDIIQMERKIELLELKENIGIAAAQNIGIQKAIENNFEAVLFLDQDTKPPENLVEELLSGIRQLEKEGNKVATIGPLVYNRDSKSEYKSLINKGKDISDFIEKDAIISSGSIILKQVYEEVGGFESDLFIDVVDFEWCWRARQKGYKSFISKKVEMEHRFGERSISILGVFKLIIPSPVRHYYQYRNLVILFPRSYVPKYWKVRSCIEKIVELVVIPIFVKPRLKRVKFMFKGFKHGLEGIKGKIQ